MIAVHQWQLRPYLSRYRGVATIMMVSGLPYEIPPLGSFPILQVSMYSLRVAYLRNCLITHTGYPSIIFQN